MRLVDVIFRRGHLSERALVDVCMTGERPVHLDRCDLCATRAVELARWLDDIRTLGVEAADEVFPPERLAAQETQILRRLEQFDRPARVISFPAQTRHDRLELGARGISPAWVGIAAAAGLVLGVFGSQIHTRFFNPPQPAIAVVAPQAEAPDAAIQTASNEPPPPASLQDLDENGRVAVPAFEALDNLTPRLTPGGERTDRRE